MLAGLLATMRVSGGLQSCSLLEPDELVCMWWAKDWRLSSRYIWPAENENRCFPFTARFCPGLYVLQGDLVFDCIRLKCVLDVKPLLSADLSGANFISVPNSVCK